MKNAKTVEITKKVPPDGGYGWVIAFAMGLNSFIYIPMMHCFGLIFKDTFAELGLSAAQSSLIVNLHAAFGMLTGLLNGVLLKTFGYRKLAFLAAILYSSGIVVTSLVQDFKGFIISYGLVASQGFGMCRSSYGFALNTYFKKRRSQALSYAVTIMGFGSIVFPQLVNLLMKFYTPEGVLLILGGICAHFFVTAMLLQPVKWHMKKEQITEQRNEEEKFCDVEICGSHWSLNEVEEDPKKPQSKCLSAAVNIFDLDLLKDPVFINILVGMACAIFSELNFTVLTPFILNDYGLTIDQIATFMSVAGFADIVFRFLAPYIGSYLKKTPRQMFVYTLLILIIMRIVLLVSTDFSMILLSATGLGIAKGIRRVYVGLIVPNYVSLDKLASASGMEMMINGFSILVGGSILGVVRDVTGSYYSCIVIMNCVTFVTIVLWSIEDIVIKCRKSKKDEKASEVEEGYPLNKI